MDRKSIITPRDLECMLCDETAGPMALPLSLLEKITDGFSEEQEIGRGGFAVVYKGILETKTVAVKRMSNTYMYEKEFQREVECLMMVKHKNVVRFLGYCADTQGSMEKFEGKFVMADIQQRLLCFEYLFNGSLQEYITDISCQLQWKDCFQIITGICQGLHYLHQKNILHLDLKPANILLGDNWVPKITDFGISRCFDQMQSQVITNIAGTPGYLAPESFNRTELTYRNSYRLDIYSLGVVIIEILTRKKGYHDVQKVVENWSNMLEESHRDVQLKQVQVCAEIGIQCINSNPETRPDTQYIINILNEYIETDVITPPQDIGPQEGISGNLATSFTSNRSMDLATGAIGSLLPKLSQLLNEFNLETSIRIDVDCVIQELRVMHADLCSVSEVQRDNNNEQIKLVKIWAGEVKELSYDIEDVVDGILMHVEGSEAATSTERLMVLIQKMTSLLKQGRTSDQIGGTIKDIRNQVEEVVANTVSTINAYDLSALVKDREKLFGIDDAMKEFTKRLRGADGNGDVYAQDLKVHSIFGSGGMGKTTLARAVYSQLKGSFHLTAFVLVGRNPNVKKLFHDILFELDEKQRYIDFKKVKLDERQLIDEVQKLLENNRYLIVIDDMWEQEVWHDFLQFAFVDSKCGSKIITTTRTSEVSTIGTDVYKLAPLSPGYAEELFYATLSLEESRCDVADEVIEKILSKCGGVPLAIITVARLLASKQREDWPKVYNSIGFGHGFNEDAENTRKILLFSYGDLPRHLKTCLLHLSIFQEDKLIDKHTVIWKWVAECFVHEEPGRGLFELGERYFNQLVSRSMIQLVVQTPVSLFCIHDLVTDMICSLSKDENFVTVLEGDEQETSSKNNARRIVVQKRYIEPLTANCMVQLRSFYATDCYIDVMPPLSSFKVLRVLSIQGCKFIEDQPDLLAHIGKLLQLRYLGLEDMPIHNLPEEIGNLRFLQTLILNRTMINELPRSVGRLKQLKCLRATICYHLRVSDWMVNMTSLEDLALVGVNMPPVFAEGLGKLKELRHLQILVDATIGFYSWNRALVESIGNLLKLQSLQIHGLSGSGDYIWEGFVPPRHLHSMTVLAGISRVPRWMDSTHLPSLSYLELDLLNMEARCLEILGRFPELHTLKLLTQKGVWLVVTGSGVFPKLRHLYSRTMLRFQRGVMPRLEHLELTVGVRLLEEANFDCDFTSLGNLHSLQKVRVQLEYWNSTDDPKYEKRIVAALKLAVDTHPRRPIVHWNRTIERSH